jgi:hypothetical protein
VRERGSRSVYRNSNGRREAGARKLFESKYETESIKFLATFLIVSPSLMVAGHVMQFSMRTAINKGATLANVARCPGPACTPPA